MQARNGSATSRARKCVKGTAAAVSDGPFDMVSGRRAPARETKDADLSGPRLPNELHRASS